MVNFRDVNENDILKEWFNFIEETYLCYADKQDRENEFKFDGFREQIFLRIFLSRIKSMLINNLIFFMMIL